MKDRPDASLIGINGMNSFRHVGKLKFCHDAKDMFLAFEIVEERAFADISGLGDVFDGNVGKSSVRKELKCCTEKAEARFFGSPLSAALVNGTFVEPRDSVIQGSTTSKCATLVHI